MQNLAVIEYSSGRIGLEIRLPQWQAKNQKVQEMLVKLPNGLEVKTKNINPSRSEIIGAVRSLNGKEKEKEQPKQEKTALHFIDRSKIVLDSFSLDDKYNRSVSEFLPEKERIVFDLEKEKISVRFYENVDVVFHKIKTIEKEVYWYSLVKAEKSLDIKTDDNSLDIETLSKYDISQKLKNIRLYTGETLFWSASKAIEGYEICVLRANGSLHDWVKEEAQTKKWTAHEYQKVRDAAKKSENEGKGVVYTSAA